MQKTLLPLRYKLIAVLLFTAFFTFGYAPGLADTEQQMLDWSNRCLMQSFDAAAAGKLKKWEITLTAGGFMRMRKTFATGKQEYFSFHLQRFADMDYTGTVAAGTLSISTRDTAIIVQTYHDRKGDIDTMASVLAIPVKNMEPERLDSLRNVLLYFRDKKL